MPWSDMLSGNLHSLPHSLPAGGPALQAVSRDAGTMQPLTIWMGSCCNLPPPSPSISTEGGEKSQQGYLCQHMIDKDLLNTIHSPKLW